MQIFEKFNFFRIKQGEITLKINTECWLKDILHSFHLVQVVNSYFPWRWKEQIILYFTSDTLDIISIA